MINNYNNNKEQEKLMTNAKKSSSKCDRLPERYLSKHSPLLYFLCSFLQINFRNMKFYMKFSIDCTKFNCIDKVDSLFFSAETPDFVSTRFSHLYEKSEYKMCRIALNCFDVLVCCSLMQCQK